MAKGPLDGPWPLGKNDKNTSVAMAVGVLAAAALMRVRKTLKDLKEENGSKSS